MPIANTGYWTTTDGKEHIHDASLALSLVKFANMHRLSTIADFGCGLGNYVWQFRKSGLDAVGYDGNPNTEALTKGNCKTLELAKDFDLKKQFDLVISLEVGEHIPAEFESVFLKNITNHCSRYLVLSWAIPGQDGIGHVNCKPNQYIIGKLAELGFTYEAKWSGILRNRSRLHWFKNTLMVFKRND